jgi:hypothetical protein
MKYALLFLLITGVLRVDAQNAGAPAISKADSINASVTPKLNVPFGTIVKLEIEIYDGDSLQMKAYEGTYLFKINAVNGVLQRETLIMSFQDETEELAIDNFQLYKLTSGKTANSVSSQQSAKMKKNYVGKKFTLMAYETGQFAGIPNDYFKYRPVTAGKSFYFQNYLVVVANLKK